MIIAELTISDVEALDNLIGQVMADLRFTSFMYDDNGTYISQQSERDAAFERLIAMREHDVLNMENNTELKGLSFQDVLYLTYEEIEELYLKDILPKVNEICRNHPLSLYDAFVSDDIPDEYLNKLITLRWKENLKLWTLQWQNEAKKWEENETAINN